MKKFKEEVLIDKIKDEMYYEVKRQRKILVAGYPDLIYIQASKIIAKKFKIKYQDILKMYNPSKSLNNSKSWDSNGNIINI